MEEYWTENAFMSPPSSSSESNTQHATPPATQPQAPPPASLVRSPSLPPQIADCAVSVYGWAIPIPDGVDKSGLNRLYCELPPVKVPWQQAAREMLRQGKWPWGDSFRTTAPGDNPSPGSSAGLALLVGFVLTGLEPDHFNPAPTIPKYQVGGDSTDPGGLWDAPPTLVPDLQDKKIVMVVAMFDHRPRKFTRLYALLRSTDPESHFCKPYKVEADECFYLPLFRRFEERNTNGFGGRLTNWKKIVRRACILPMNMPLGGGTPVDGGRQPPQEAEEAEE